MDVNWFPGHMAKTLRELKDHMKLVDMVIETCDARIPESSRNPELYRLLGQKPRILVLNKADLADPAVTNRWIAWYKQSGIIAIACDSTRRNGLSEINKAAQALNQHKTDRAMAKGRLFRPIRILVVGIPNTGKSTLINALCGRKLAKTADKPGVTRQTSWIRSGGKLELMDSPGVLWPKLGDSLNQLRLASTGAIRDEILPIEEIAAGALALLAQSYPALIKERYRLEDISLSGDELLVQAARLRGCLLSGGKIDTMRFAVLFLDELRAGKIGRISLEQPPMSD